MCRKKKKISCKNHENNFFWLTWWVCRTSNIFHIQICDLEKQKNAANISNHTWLAVGSSTIQCAVCVVNKSTVLRHPNRFKKTFHPTNCSISKHIRHFNKTNLLKHNQTSSRPSLTSEASVLHGHQNVKYCTFLSPSSLSLPRSH